ncbi:hypothetical protein HMPREF3220_04385 [Citrobacter koseri]|nr:hypothetical protein HMPREF3220_04385 [Citrobacter koseri]KXA01985.1 hypothetical protein HMPREF3207_02566 [Citrobacter koseri]
MVLPDGDVKRLIRPTLRTVGRASEAPPAQMGTEFKNPPGL